MELKSVVGFRVWGLEAVYPGRLGSHGRTGDREQEFLRCALDRGLDALDLGYFSSEPAAKPGSQQP